MSVLVMMSSHFQLWGWGGNVGVSFQGDLVPDINRVICASCCVDRDYQRSVGGELCPESVCDEKVYITHLSQPLRPVILVRKKDYQRFFRFDLFRRYVHCCASLGKASKPVRTASDKLPIWISVAKPCKIPSLNHTFSVVQFLIYSACCY